MGYFIHLKKYSIISLTCTCLVSTQIAHAGGFLLNAESAATLGTALAGSAALAEDATTNYYNPAGLVHFNHQQIAGSANAIFLKQRFNGTTQASYDIFSKTQTQAGSTSAFTRGAVPAFYYVTPLVRDYLWLGIGVTSPTSFYEKYPSDSVLRYAITNAKIQTVNLNINMAFKIYDQLSIGYGIDILRADSIAKNNILNISAGPDWNFSYNAGGNAYGANVGVLYQPFNNTRIGFSYRSQMRIEMDGTSALNTQGTFSSSSFSPLRVNNFNLNFKLPPVTYLSVYQIINPKWDVMGTISLEQWNVFKEVVMNNVPAPTVRPLELHIQENFHDILNLSIGTRYQLNPQWKLKTGFGYSPSAVTTDNRNVIIPATDFWFITIGAHYQATPCLGIDMAFAHPSFTPAKIKHQMTTSVTSFVPVNYTASENGKIKLSSAIIGAQFEYDFI